MTRQLTVREAQITTASVEVKTLTISGKQVTLAVFRQLKEEPLIADDGTLRGIPWGTVNYHPDKRCSGTPDGWTQDDPRGPHLHVVWQKGSELRRATQSPHYRLPYTFSPPSGEAFLIAHVRDALAGKTDGPLGDFIPTEEHAHSLPLKEHEIGFEVPFRYGVSLDVPRCVNRTLGHEEGKPPYPLGDYVRLGGQLLPRRFAEIQDSGLSSGLPIVELVTDDLWREVLQEIRDETERQERHVRNRRALTDLPQLFIAV